MSPKNREDVAATLHIATQYRSALGMTYELECRGAQLDLQVSQRKAPDDAGEWRVEARPGRAVDAARITEWGATRRDALSEVARSWTSQASALGLPAFDWEAVARVLSAVRAI